MKSDDIQKEQHTETAFGRDDLVFYDVRNEPFSVYGLYHAKE